MARFASSDELFAHLLSYVNLEKGQATELRLDRMRELCAALGDPQAACPSIHIAGSKGKGSVSAMIARILEASGSKVGLYTSPHFLRWKERMSLAGEEMPEEYILEAAKELLGRVEGRRAEDFPGSELPTYFELTTLIAFDAFRRAGCSRMVVETGLGGRLDSTNVLASAASVITPIELEHTEWLGDTIPLVAGEKAGIIKPGMPCFLSAQVPEAREVFVRSCAARGSPLREVEALVNVEGVSVDRNGTGAFFSFVPGGRLASRFPKGIEARSPLVGKVQAQNMALAILAAAESEEALGSETIVAGLARARLPARFEILDRDPPLVLDGAHTPRSAALTLESFEALFPGPKALLFACAADKRRDELAAILAPRFERVTITRPGNFKQSDSRAVWGSFRAFAPGALLIEDHVQAIPAAIREADRLGLPLLVTGSFYLCAEAALILRG